MFGCDPIPEDYVPKSRTATLPLDPPHGVIKDDNGVEHKMENLCVCFEELTGTPEEIGEKAKRNILSMLAAGISKGNYKQYMILIEEFRKY